MPLGHWGIAEGRFALDPRPPAAGAWPDIVKYKLVIFDFDGTLADSLSWFAGMINEVADRFHFRRLDAGQLANFRAYETRELLRQQGVSAWKLPRIIAYVRARMAEEIGRISRFDGVDRLLRELAAKGVALAIVSTNSLANVQAGLGPENAPFIRHFACGASMLGKSAKLKKVLKLSGIPASEAIYVGDEVRDIEAARKAGMASGAVAWGYAQIETLRAHAPDLVFDNPAALASLAD
jgi:phosphoglycolate phosphatase